MKRRKSKKAFTLIEVMVVVVILGILATVVTIKVTQYLAKAKVNTARIQMRELMKGLELFKQENDKYPENLEELIEATEENPEAFIDVIPLDPWGNGYEYMSDTEHGYDLICYGADGQEGGEGNDADINSWELAGGTTEEGEETGTSSSTGG
ncbi:MAG: type II secretion system major pseudopilin GspG [Planctomycetota bacterium]|jgi:general secretion pathway protein G